MLSRIVLALALLAVGAVTVTVGGNGTGQAAPGEVVILSTSVSGGLDSYEAKAIVAAGKTPVLKTPAEWSSMTAADFASYDGIVLGDPTCTTTPEINIAAAEDNALVWGPKVNGNVIIIGSDPVYHAKVELIDQGMAFALAEPGKTGAYIDLSCYYHNAPAPPPFAPVPVLDGINGGGFTVIGASNLPGLNDVHIVATHPALTGLTDAYLSNWGNSVHEGFETWPIQFEALAIARDPAGSYEAPDGTVGYPYILARGVRVISDISLAPESSTNPIGTSHTLTATVTSDDPVPGSPVVGVDVTFEVIDGPHIGVSGVDTTDDNGQATFSYDGMAVGVDTIQAKFVDAKGVTQRSNRVTKEWEATTPTPTPTNTATPEPAKRAHPHAATIATVPPPPPPPAPTAQVLPAVVMPATGDGGSQDASPSVWLWIVGAGTIAVGAGWIVRRKAGARR